MGSILTKKRLSKELDSIRQRIGRGENLSQKELDEFVEYFYPYFKSNIKEVETFSVVYSDGTSTGVMGPSWIFHLLGLRHRCFHVFLTSSSGLLILRIRSYKKDAYAGCFDASVGGHVKGNDTFEEAALNALKKRLNLGKDLLGISLEEGRLKPVGWPYATFDKHPKKEYYNAEIHQIYTATITSDGISRIKFDEKEIESLCVCSKKNAWELLKHEKNIAIGLRYSLPLYLTLEEDYYCDTLEEASEEEVFINGKEIAS
jgi:isopentenyldiphosphate isomerase